MKQKLINLQTIARPTLLLVLCFALLNFSSCKKDETQAVSRDGIFTTEISFKNVETGAPIQNTDISITRYEGGNVYGLSKNTGKDGKISIIGSNDVNEKFALDFNVKYGADTAISYPTIQIPKDTESLLFSYSSAMEDSKIRKYEIPVYNFTMVNLRLKQENLISPEHDQGRLLFNLGPQEYLEPSSGHSAVLDISSTYSFKLLQGRLIDTTLNIYVLAGLEWEMSWLVQEEYPVYNPDTEEDSWNYLARNSGSLDKRKFNTGASETIEIRF